MWKVEVFEYNKYVKCSTIYREFFNSRDAALDCFNQFVAIKANVILEDLTPVGDDEYSSGEIIQSPTFTAKHKS
jgi:hypothetical protein